MNKELNRSCKKRRLNIIDDESDSPIERPGAASSSSFVADPPEIVDTSKLADTAGVAVTTENTNSAETAVVPYTNSINTVEVADADVAAKTTIANLSRIFWRRQSFFQERIFCKFNSTIFVGVNTQTKTTFSEVMFPSSSSSSSSSSASFADSTNSLTTPNATSSNSSSSSLNPLTPSFTPSSSSPLSSLSPLATNNSVNIPLLVEDSVRAVVNISDDSDVSVSATCETGDLVLPVQSSMPSFGRLMDSLEAPLGFNSSELFVRHCRGKKRERDGTHIYLLTATVGPYATISTLSAEEMMAKICKVVLAQIQNKRYFSHNELRGLLLHDETVQHCPTGITLPFPVVLSSITSVSLEEQSSELLKARKGIQNYIAEPSARPIVTQAVSRRLLAKHARMIASDEVMTDERKGSAISNTASYHPFEATLMRDPLVLDLLTLSRRNCEKLYSMRLAAFVRQRNPAVSEPDKIDERFVASTFRMSEDSEISVLIVRRDKREQITGGTDEDFFNVGMAWFCSANAVVENGCLPDHDAPICTMPEITSSSAMREAAGLSKISFAFARGVESVENGHQDAAVPSSSSSSTKPISTIVKKVQPSPAAVSPVSSQDEVEIVSVTNVSTSVRAATVAGAPSQVTNLAHTTVPAIIRPPRDLLDVDANMMADFISEQFFMRSPSLFPLEWDALAIDVNTPAGYEPTPLGIAQRWIKLSALNSTTTQQEERKVLAANLIVDLMFLINHLRYQKQLVQQDIQAAVSDLHLTTPIDTLYPRDFGPPVFGSTKYIENPWMCAVSQTQKREASVVPSCWGLRSPWPTELRQLFRHADMGIEYAVRMTAALPFARSSDHNSIIHNRLGELTTRCRRRLDDQRFFQLPITPARFFQHFLAVALRFEGSAATPYHSLIPDENLGFAEEARPSCLAPRTLPLTYLSRLSFLQGQLLNEVRAELMEPRHEGRSSSTYLPNQPAGLCPTSFPGLRIRLLQTKYAIEDKEAYCFDQACCAAMIIQDPTIHWQLIERDMVSGRRPVEAERIPYNRITSAENMWAWSRADFDMLPPRKGLEEVPLVGGMQSPVNPELQRTIKDAVAFRQHAVHRMALFPRARAGVKVSLAFMKFSQIIQESREAAQRGNLQLEIGNKFARDVNLFNIDKSPAQRRAILESCSRRIPADLLPNSSPVLSSPSPAVTVRRELVTTAVTLTKRQISAVATGPTSFIQSASAVAARQTINPQLPRQPTDEWTTDVHDWDDSAKLTKSTVRAASRKQKMKEYTSKSSSDEHSKRRTHERHRKNSSERRHHHHRRSKPRRESKESSRHKYQLVTHYSKGSSHRKRSSQSRCHSPSSRTESSYNEDSFTRQGYRSYVDQSTTYRLPIDYDPSAAFRCLSSVKFRRGLGGKNSDYCAVCRLDFEPQEDLKGLPCGHLLHLDCVLRSLLRNPCCPFCNTPITSAQWRKIYQHR